MAAVSPLSVMTDTSLKVKNKKKFKKRKNDSQTGTESANVLSANSSLPASTSSKHQTFIHGDKANSTSKIEKQGILKHSTNNPDKNAKITKTLKKYSDGMLGPTVQARNKDEKIRTNKMEKNSQKKKSIKKLGAAEGGVGDGEGEDVAESVDSGCIPDLTMDRTDWPQVKMVLVDENNFISSLLSWVPPSQQKLQEIQEQKEKELVAKQEEEENKKRKLEEKSERDLKRRKKVAFQECATEYEEIEKKKVVTKLELLEDKYHQKLVELRQNRKKGKWMHGHDRKEARLAKKLKNMKKRKKMQNKKAQKLHEQCYQTTVEEEKNHLTKRGKEKKAIYNIYNKKGELVFSKFDFKKQDGFGEKDKKPKDLKNVLNEALKEKEKVKKLEQQGDKEAASQQLQNKAWASALSKAEGVKVKNNPDLLKKALKRQDDKKKISRQKWEQRLNTVEKHKEERQQKRQKNVKARKQEHLSKKMKGMKKKGHIVPGF